MGVHTRPAFLHFQEAVLHPILQLQNTRSSSLLGAVGFSEPTEKSTVKKCCFLYFLSQNSSLKPQIYFKLIKRALK